MSAAAPSLRFERTLTYAARFTAQASQNIWLAALFLVAGTSSKPALDLSSLFIAMLIPSIVLGLPGGSLADRLGPGRGYAAGALLRLLPVAAGIWWLDGGTSAWVLAFLYSTGSQVFTPAELALVRPLQDAHVGRVHSWFAALQYAGQGAGMLVLAPALYFLGGPTAMVIGAAVGLSLLFLLTVVLAVRVAPLARAFAAGSARAALSFGATMRFFGRESIARYAVIALGLKMVVSKGIVVALPFYLERDLGLGWEAIAYLFVPGILGVLAGLWWCSRELTLARAHEVLRLSLLGLVAALAALAALDYGITAVAQYSHIPPVARLEAEMNTTFAVAIPVAFLLGASLSGLLIAGRVALTETAPPGQHGRVFAVQLTITETAISLPLLALGIGTTYAGARVTLAGMALLVAGFLLLAELDRARSLFARRPALEPEAAPSPSAGA
ncbi:MAG: hypothetical protein N2041_08760 [Tepidiforma sp.]|nr:hypothetical protein [Tepidiforma sp.]